MCFMIIYPIFIFVIFIKTFCNAIYFLGLSYIGLHSSDYFHAASVLKAMDIGLI